MVAKIRNDTPEIGLIKPIMEFIDSPGDFRGLPDQQSPIFRKLPRSLEGAFASSQGFVSHAPQNNKKIILRIMPIRSLTVAAPVAALKRSRIAVIAILGCELTDHHTLHPWLRARPDLECRYHGKSIGLILK